jgi:nitrite reductase (NADH) small subunit
MSEVLVCAANDISDRNRKVVRIGSFEVGIFNMDGKFYAWENVCPHLAGPACQGVMVPLTTEGVCEDRASLGRVFSKDHMNIVCPWHGYEFDIRTGQHPTLPKMRLRSIPVAVREGQIYVKIPASRAV